MSRRVAFVGSSSVEPNSPLPAALAVELGLGSDWVALGRRGSRLRQWTAPELPSDVRAAVVMIVGNDPRPTAEGVRAVNAALRRLVPTVVWIPPPPYPSDSRIAGRDRRMREALAASGAAWVDVPIAMGPELFSPDRIHPTRAGYRSYARQVGPRLWERLLERPAPARPRLELPSRPGVIGCVFGAGGARLPLTSEDALWLARACVGEGGGEADTHAVASTMLRRWVMLRETSTSSPFGSLTDLVVGRYAGPDPHEGQGREVALRGYSQPVAVQWRARGEHTERRRRVRTLSWAEIEPQRRAAVLRILTGREALSAWPAVHFAARGLVERRLPEHPGWRVVDVPGARNVFVSTSRSRLYRDPVVVGADGRGSTRAPSSPPPRARPPVLVTAARGAGRALFVAGAVTLGGVLFFGRG